MSDAPTFTVQLELTPESVISSFRLYIFEDDENGHTTMMVRSSQYKKAYVLKKKTIVLAEVRKTGHRLYHD
jgi:hypothetical protein